MASNSPVLINFARDSELEKLPGVGHKTAQRIVRYRKTHGNLTHSSIFDIQRLRVTPELMAKVSFNPNPAFRNADDQNLPHLQASDDKTFVTGMANFIDKYQGKDETQVKFGDSRLATMQYPFIPTTPPPYETEISEKEDSESEGTDSDGPSTYQFREKVKRRTLKFPDTPKDRKPQKFRPSTLPKSLEFDGTSNWLLFKKKFLHYVEASDWSSKEKRDALCWCLKGKAGEFYTMLCEVGEEPSYKKLMAQLDKRFKGEELEETLQAKFRKARQRGDEDLLDWADRVLMLAARAFKGLHEPFIRKNSIMQFCQSCKHAEAGRHASLQKPKSMDAAVEAIEWYIAVCDRPFRVKKKSDRAEYQVPVYSCYSDEEDDSSDSSDDGYEAHCSKGKREESVRELRQGRGRRELQGRSPPPILKKPTDLEGRVSSLESTCNVLAENVQLLASKFDQVLTEMKILRDDVKGLREEVTRRPRSRSNSASRPTSPSYKCFNCNQSGHFRRDCPHLPEKKVQFPDLNSYGLGMKTGSPPLQRKV